MWEAGRGDIGAAGGRLFTVTLFPLRKKVLIKLHDGTDEKGAGPLSEVRADRA